MTVSASHPKRQKGESFRPATEADLDRRFFDHNMAEIAKYLPALHQQLSAFSHPHSRLLISDRGDFDIEFGGVRLYGMGARAAARRRVDDFFKAPPTNTRFGIVSPGASHFDQYANVVASNILHRATTEVGAQIATTPTRPCFHLVVLGVGLAEQLPLLIEETDCYHIVLIEPNIEFLYHSLYTFDWRKFIRKIVADGRFVVFDDNTTAKDMAVGVRTQLRYINTAFIDGTFIYRSYRNSILEAAAREMAADANLFMTGLGFLEDEIDMVRNTYRNLKDYAGRYFQRRKRPSPLPAFVVASGPSIDNDLEFLRANADRAIVISCGTSLRILLRNGIVPDFHMEMENVPAVADLMNRLSASFSLKDVNLIASSTVDPGVKPHFDRVVFYFRAGLASFPMFSPAADTNIPQGLPTVSNLGLSFAQQIGCRTICLFGVDLGARDPKKHHAKDAPYNAGELEFNTVIDEPVPGNLGGTVYSEMIYLWSRDTMQDVIQQEGPNLTYYNCSDGVRILGTTPKLSRTISSPPVSDKKKIVAEVLARFNDYTPDMFAKSWADRNVVLDVRAFQKKLLECCLPLRRAGAAKRGQSPRIELDYMHRVVRALVPPKDTTPEVHYFRGTMFMSMIGAHFYLTRVHDPKKHRAVGRIIKEEFIKVIGVIADRVIEFYRELDPEKIAADEAKVDKILGKSLRRLKTALAPRRSKGGQSTRARTPTRRPARQAPRSKKAPPRRQPPKNKKRPSPKAVRGPARRRR